MRQPIQHLSHMGLFNGVGISVRCQCLNACQRCLSYHRFNSYFPFPSLRITFLHFAVCSLLRICWYSLSLALNTGRLLISLGSSASCTSGLLNNNYTRSAITINAVCPPTDNEQVVFNSSSRFQFKAFMDIEDELLDTYYSISLRHEEQTAARHHRCLSASNENNLTHKWNDLV